MVTYSRYPDWWLRIRASLLRTRAGRGADPRSPFTRVGQAHSRRVLACPSAFPRRARKVRQAPARPPRHGGQHVRSGDSPVRPVDDKLHAPARAILAMPMRLPTLLDANDGGSPGEGRPDQRTAPRLVDVGPPSWRTRFVRWSNRAPRAKRGSVSFFLFVAVGVLTIAGGSLLIVSLATLE